MHAGMTCLTISCSLRSLFDISKLRYSWLIACANASWPHMYAKDRCTRHNYCLSLSVDSWTYSLCSEWQCIGVCHAQLVYRRCHSIPHVGQGRIWHGTCLDTCSSPILWSRCLGRATLGESGPKCLTYHRFIIMTFLTQVSAVEKNDTHEVFAMKAMNKRMVKSKKATWGVVREKRWERNLSVVCCYMSNHETRWVSNRSSQSRCELCMMSVASGLWRRYPLRSCWPWSMHFTIQKRYISCSICAREGLLLIT